jgi:putative FmdB family regulatory protein
MPIYAYRCTSCGHAQDVLQKMSDPVLTVCPACNAPAYAKQVTAAGFQLKGSGWYVTDFRGGNSAKPEAKADANADAKADAKPDGAPTPAASGDAAAAPAASNAPASSSAPAPAAAKAAAPPPAPAPGPASAR